MTHVRLGKDISSIQKAGDVWVAAQSGGVSTFSIQGAGPHWWMLQAGYEYPDELAVINDHGNDFSWEPSFDMPLVDFTDLLAAVDSAFIKIS